MFNRLVGCLLLLTLVMTLLPACSVKVQREIPLRSGILEALDLERDRQVLIAERDLISKDQANQESISVEVPSVNTDEVISTKWPTDQVPPDLPQYPAGSIVNSGGLDQDFYILIETEEVDLKDYLESLLSSGWTLTYGNSSEGFEVIKGRYQVTSQWNNSESHLLQLNIRTLDLAQWPKERVPSDFIDPIDYVLIGQIWVQGDLDMGYFTFTADGMNEDKAKAYMQLYLDQGWQGDTAFVSKDVKWQDRSYSLNVEIFETNGQQTTFSCNFSSNE